MDRGRDGAVDVPTLFLWGADDGFGGEEVVLVSELPWLSRDGTARAELLRAGSGNVRGLVTNTLPNR